MRYLTFPALLFLASLLLASPATADTPGFLDGPVLDALCKTLRVTDGCPECACEPITQTRATETWTETATPITHGVLVAVRGKASGSRIDRVHAVLGRPGALYDGGVVVDRVGSGEVRTAQTDRKITYEVTTSSRHYDMCPGACEHHPVGAVHLFVLQVSESSKTADEATPGGERHESMTRTLVSCFMADDKEPVTCYATALGFSQRLLKGKGKASKAKASKAKFRGWQRTWGTGGPHGMQLKVGPIKGAEARSVRKEAVGKAPRTSSFRDLGKRGDTVLLTAKGGGRLIAVPKVSRIPKAGD